MSLNYRIIFYPEDNIIWIPIKKHRRKFETIDDIPKGSKIFQNISEQQELELSKETEGNNGDWKVFWTLATFMLLPIL